MIWERIICPALFGEDEAYGCLVDGCRFSCLNDLILSAASAVMAVTPGRYVKKVYCTLVCFLRFIWSFR